MRSRLVTITVSAAVFVALLVAVLAAHLEPLRMDVWWASVLDGTRSAVMTDVQRFVSVLGAGLVGGLIVPGVVLLALWRRRGRFAALTFAVGMVASVVAVQLTKHLVARPRPPAQLVVSDFGSFPSGHVANAATITVLLLLLLRRRWLVAVAVAWTALMAVSRTYLNAHWLSDTFAGAALGTSVAVGAVLLIGLLDRSSSGAADRRARAVESPRGAVCGNEHRAPDGAGAALAPVREVL